MAESAVQANNKPVEFKGSKRLPKHVRKAAKRGLISESQMSKLKGKKP
jgi:hypothetical protein